MFCVGIDWASDHHDICVIDEKGMEVDNFRITHQQEGMNQLRERIRKLSVSDEEIIFAIETPSNLLVTFLLEEGHVVYAINPRSVDRYRDRYRVSGARDDKFDAMVIANIIRTDREQFRELTPDSELARELRALTRDEQKLVRTKTRFINQIQDCLKDYYPVALGLFSQIDQRITVDYLLKFPEPGVIPVQKLEKFFKKHSYPSAAEKAKEIHKILSKPQIFVKDFTVRAKSRFLITLVEQLRSLLGSLADYQKEIKRLYENHPDSKVFKSLPGSGDKGGPRLLAEIGDNRDKYLNRSNLQCDGGTAPVTSASGKSKSVRMRFACRKVFRNVIYQFAFTSLNQSGWARKFYDFQRDKGKSHTKALRALGNKWLKIIFRLWKDGSVYNEDIHLANLMRYQLNQEAQKGCFFARP